MADVDEAPQGDHVELVADIVSAYTANNSIPPSELPSLIGSVHAALTRLVNGPSSTEPKIEKPTPAEIRKSIKPDALISFIDHKPYKTLKRHLTGHGLDPHSYRERYGLPRDYPMVTANYAAQRAELARASGLGQQGGRAQRSAEEGETAPKAPKTRGRPKKG
jgi:predicted transcriptional regulator